MYENMKKNTIESMENPMKKEKKKKKQGSKSLQTNMFMISFIPMILMSTVISIMALNGGTSKQLIIAILIVIVMAVISILSISWSVAKAIKNAKDCILQIAGGDLNIKVDTATKERNDEIGLIGNALCELSDKLKEIIREIKNSADEVLESGNQLENMSDQSMDAISTVNNAVSEISASSFNQTMDVKVAADETEEMAKLISSIVAGVKRLDITSDAMKSDGEETLNILRILDESNSRTNNAVEKIDQQIHHTNEAVMKINEAVSVISNIAKQTSLLALNASIEAARAGENGRGFSIVAEEIGKLASQSNQSAVEIGLNIRTLNEESEKTLIFMDEVVTNVNSQQVKLVQTRERFIKVNQGICLNQAETTEIRKQTEVCDEARKEVVRVIVGLSETSESNTTATKETMASMEDVCENVKTLDKSAKKLQKLAVELNQHVDFFKI